MKDGVKIGQHPLVVRCMKGIFFKVETSTAQIYQHLGRNIVLGYLRTFESTGKRGQTIHKMDVSYIQEMDSRYVIKVALSTKNVECRRR